MKRFVKKKGNDEKFKPRICPRILEKFKVVGKERCSVKAIHAGLGKYVVSWKDEQYEVDLAKRTCECRMWEISGIHVDMPIYGAIHKQRGKLEDYINNCYNKETYLLVTRE